MGIFTLSHVSSGSGFLTLALRLSKANIYGDFEGEFINGLDFCRPCIVSGCRDFVAQRLEGSECYVNASTQSSHFRVAAEVVNFISDLHSRVSHVN